MTEFAVVFITLILSLTILLASRSITVFLHEVGHAVPAIIFTRKSVSIFIGSYGEEENLVRLKTGKSLAINIKSNPLTWQKGMVLYYPDNLSFTQKLTITILGPLTSLIFAVVAIWMCFNFDLHGFFKLFCVLFFLSALFDLRNIYPDESPFILNDGTTVFCDGYNLKLLIRERKEKRPALKAFRLLEDNQYKKARLYLAKLKLGTIKSALADRIQYAITSKQFIIAKKLYFQIMKIHPIEADENILSNMGLIESLLDNHNEALEFYNKVLELNNENEVVLCNRAFTYTILGDYEAAIQDFDTVIAHSPEYSYAFANRGYAKIKLDRVEEGLAEIRKALSFDNKCAYAHRNLGIYNLESGNNDKALQHFELALELDPNTYLIQEYIDRAKIVCKQ